MTVAVSSTPIDKLKSRDVRTDLDISHDELLALLELTEQVKQLPGRYAAALAGRNLGLLFEKPSLRTRLTFELAIKQLGGDAVTSVGPVAEREPLKDVARNLDRWVQGIVARTFEQSTIDELARWSSVPVINALSNLYHPCQALADVFTLRERFGDLGGIKIAFVGDGNNVAHSLMLCCVRLGMHFSIATPPGYGPDKAVVAKACELAAAHGSTVTITNDPQEAVSGVNVVYTDVWASMGHEAEAAERRRVFSPYQINERLLEAAGPRTAFMHCLPAKRDQEVTDGVIESQNSIVFDQAENRLHAQKALLLMLIS